MTITKENIKKMSKDDQRKTIKEVARMIRENRKEYNKLKEVYEELFESISKGGKK